MRNSTAHILIGFIEEMKKDMVGWNGEVIGKVSYELLRLLENPLEIPEDKKTK